MQGWSWASFRAGMARRGVPDGLLIAMAATVVVLISLLLPWYKGSVLVHNRVFGLTLGGTVISGAQLSGTTSALASPAGGWRYLILLVAVVELIYLLALALWAGRPGTLTSWLHVASGLGALLVALAFAGFLLRPAAKGPDFGAAGLPFSYKVTDVAGPYIAFAAALAALVFLAIAIRERTRDPAAAARSETGAG
jgi:hypothetical protein